MPKLKAFLFATILTASIFFSSLFDWRYAFFPELGPSYRSNEEQFGASVFMPIQGGTGNGNIPSYGQLLVGNSSGTYTLTATSSLGIIGLADGTFSTTSANWWASLGLAFSTTSADYWETQQAPRGGGGGSGTVGTSTIPTVGQLSYWTSNAFPSLLGSVATSSLTINAPLTTSGTPGALVGGTNLTIDIDDIKAADLDLTDITLSDFTNDAGFTTFAYPFPSNATSTQITFSGGLVGALTGNADTATALAANGSNCTAGSYALGVDASGASEGCTDATTEINSAISTHTGDAEAHQALVTLAGTPDYLTIVGQVITRGTIDISDDTNLTAGDGLTLTGDDLDCDTASGSTFGCLSAANWTTFNSKLSAYNAWTNPVAGVSATTSTLRLAGLNASSTVLFDNATSTLFTATTAWFTNVFIGVDTLAEYISDTAGAFFTGNTETGVTVTYQDADNTVDVVCDTASGSTFGCLTSANWTVFNNKVSTTSIDTITEVETLWGGINVLTETEIDASSELAAIMDDETGTGGALVFASSPSITSPTLTTFFGTPCTGQNFLQDISDTGAFTCGAASGSSGNMSGWATTTPFGSQLLLYPVDAQTTDVAFGTNSTSTAPFWWDVSATSTYIGNGGTGSSTLQFGPSGFEWLLGFDGSDNAFKISSSTVDTGFSVSNVLSIAKATLLATFQGAVTVVGNLTASANFIFDGQTFDSFTDDATLTNNAGDLRVVDVNCTNCLGGTEIDESALTLDTSGDWTGTLDGFNGFGYPFPSNATSTALTFSGGVNVGSSGITVDNADTGTGLTIITAAVPGSWTATFPNITGTIALTGTSQTLDFGASVLEIPNGTNPTANDPGELAHDTTDNQLILDDFVIPTTQKIWSATIASTSPAFISDGLLPVPTQLDGYTITRIQCHVTTGTSKVIAVEDASANSSEDITCATTNTTDDGSITNATYSASELSYIDFGATSGAVDYVTISVFGVWTRE